MMPKYYSHRSASLLAAFNSLIPQESTLSLDQSRVLKELKKLITDTPYSLVRSHYPPRAFLRELMGQLLGSATSILTFCELQKLSLGQFLNHNRSFLRYLLMNPTLFQPLIENKILGQTLLSASAKLGYLIKETRLPLGLLITSGYNKCSQIVIHFNEAILLTQSKLLSWEKLLAFNNNLLEEVLKYAKPMTQALEKLDISWAELAYFHPLVRSGILYTEQQLDKLLGFIKDQVLSFEDFKKICGQLPKPLEEEPKFHTKEAAHLYFVNQKEERAEAQAFVNKFCRALAEPADFADFVAEVLESKRFIPLPGASL